MVLTVDPIPIYPRIYLLKSSFEKYTKFGIYTIRS